MEPIITDNVITDKELHPLYVHLISKENWYLNRHSFMEEGSIDHKNRMFTINLEPNPPYCGLLVEPGSDLWKMFVGLVPFLEEKNNIKLPNYVARVDLNSCYHGIKPVMHPDVAKVQDPSNNAISIIGHLTPVWDPNWGGSTWVEDKEINYTPGRFIVFNSRQLHRGEGPSVPINWWRIALNIILVDEFGKEAFLREGWDRDILEVKDIHLG
tara:strand:- start:104 stop:739 length:636 start_codon:yes stop_codon:yes gene_type:complete